MSAYTYLTVDNIVSGRPCRLLSVVLTASSGGAATVVLYDEQSAVAGREVIAASAVTSDTVQVEFDGLELTRGLYVDVGSNVTGVTIEWEPMATGPPG